mmetsp:Transcript_105820/g.228055  ORF Transcript_105820/g.228055 Transcript_105820/m.228055 type:complete len:375 (+) Transcript_105820:123-1247(+)
MLSWPGRGLLPPPSGRPWPRLVRSPPHSTGVPTQPSAERDAPRSSTLVRAHRRSCWVAPGGRAPGLLRQRLRDARHDHGPALARARGAVDRRLLVVPDVCLEALNVRDGHGGDLPAGLAVLRERVVVKHLHAARGLLVVDEVDEGVADVAHRALVHRHVQEVEGAAEAEGLQLPDEFTLRVAVRDVADHHRGGRPLVLHLIELLREVEVLRDTAVREVLQAIELGQGAVQQGLVLVAEVGDHGVQGGGGPDRAQATEALAVRHGADGAVRHDALVVRAHHRRRQLPLQLPQLVDARSLRRLEGIPRGGAVLVAWPQLLGVQADQVVQAIQLPVIITRLIAGLGDQHGIRRLGPLERTVQGEQAARNRLVLSLNG